MRCPLNRVNSTGRKLVTLVLRGQVRKLQRAMAEASMIIKPLCAQRTISDSDWKIVCDCMEQVNLLRIEQDWRNVSLLYRRHQAKITLLLTYCDQMAQKPWDSTPQIERLAFVSKVDRELTDHVDLAGLYLSDSLIELRQAKQDAR